MGGVVAGERVILLNAFHDRAHALHVRTIGSLLAGQPALAKQVPANERGPEFWRHRTYCMFHGGDHFFQLVYRLRDSTFVAFAANTPR